jgi:hypothetical protein
MKALFIKLFSFIVFFSVWVGLLFLLNKFWLATDHYNNEFTVKGQLIQMKTRVPKVIFVGGSNVAFGIDSKTISDSIKRPVFNSGLIAGMGMRYIFDSYEPYFHRGDIVILMPEYDHFYSDNAYGNPETLGYLPYLSDFNPWLLNSKQLGVMSLGFLKTTLQIAVKGIYFKVLHAFKPAGNVYEYKMSGFNKWGDEVSHRTLPPNINNIGAYSILGDYNASYTQHLLNQVHSLQGRGVQVFLLPPITSKDMVSLNRKQIVKIEQKLAASGCAYVVPPDSLAYPDSLLYNTVYHLNARGVAINSRRLAGYLKACLQTSLHKK